MGVFESLLRIALGSANIAAHVVRENGQRSDWEKRHKEYEEDIAKSTDPDLEEAFRTAIEDPECTEWVWEQIESEIELWKGFLEYYIQRGEDCPAFQELELLLKSGRVPFRDREGRLSNADTIESRRLARNRFLALEALMGLEGKSGYKFGEWSSRQANLERKNSSLKRYLEIVYPLDD